jgi:phage terminase large subunit-like protein
MIRGIGPIHAKKLVKALGTAVFELIEQQHPDRLCAVTGIGPKRAARISTGWADQKVIRDLDAAMHAAGLRHDRTWVLEWCMGNAVGKSDQQQPVSTKHWPEHKIDAAVELIMTIDLAMTSNVGQPEISNFIRASLFD